MVEIPEQIPPIASSAMPPAEKSRDSGLLAGCQKPEPKPAVMLAILVEPYRSAAAERTAPLVSLLTWLRLLARQPRKVCDEPMS